MRVLAAVIVSLLVSLASLPAFAQPATAPTSAVTVQPLPGVATETQAAAFDPVKATNAYLAQVKGEARARSDSYFEGSAEWLPVVDTIYALLVAGLLMWTRISAR